MVAKAKARYEKACLSVERLAVNQDVAGSIPASGDALQVIFVWALLNGLITSF